LRVAIAGSTGSIGTQTVDVVRAEPDRYEVVALGVGSSVDVLVAQARELRPKLVAVADPARRAEVASALPFAEVVDGELKAVWGAVKAIMGVLNGGRGGVDIPEDDKKSVYNQVAKYYKKFDEEAPEFNSKSLTLETDNANNKNVETSSEGNVETKDLGESSDGGGNMTPVQQAKTKDYAMSDSLHEVADMLKAHSDALNGHAQTMKAHSEMVAKKVSVLHKAADYLKDLLDHEGDETSAKEEPVVEEASNAPDDGLNKPKKTAGTEVQTKSEGEEPKPEVEEEAEPEAEKVEEIAPVEQPEKVVEDKPSGEVKSEEEVPTDGADHQVETEDELVDPDNLTDEQVQKLLDMVNAEMKNQETE